MSESRLPSPGDLRWPKRLAILLCCAFILLYLPVRDEAADLFRTGGLSTADWDEVLAEVSLLPDAGARIARISELFLDTPYQAGTLIGDETTAEVLVADLGAVDCFTFLDYVEALRRSRSLSQFRDCLVKVRYRGGVVAFGQRRHFFTDWAEDGLAIDMTAAVGKGRTRTVRKRLNEKEKGAAFVPGIPVRKRTIDYLPASALDDGALRRLKTGDYAGIYSGLPGLDVTHVGIVIRREGKLFLRHASSRKEVGKVVDSELVSYLRGRPGLVILRPRP